MTHPLGLRFIVVVGKGGVGKSAVSTALALALAARGKRTLIAMCNAKERVSYLLGTEPIGANIRNVAPGVDAVNMEPGAALEEYGMMILRVRALYKLVFENRFVHAFLRGTPGIEAWAMLGKAQFHAFETRPDGSPRYDTVIVDAPATGHGLDLLRVPKVILDVVPPGLLRREAERAWQLFTDPMRSGVLLVTLPEELPTNETLELYATLRNELQLPVCGVAVNMVWPRLFESGDLERIATLREHSGQHEAGAELTPLLAAGKARADRETEQRAQIERIARELPVLRVELPFLMSADLRRTECEALARILGAAFA